MRRLLALLAFASLAVAACGSGDGETESFAEPDTDGAMASALALVPDTGDNSAFVLVNDYASAGEALGLERPARGEATEDDVANWFIPLTIGREDTVGGLQSNGFFGSNPLDDGAWRDEIGWAPLDVDVAVEVPPNDQHTGYYGFFGDFDPDAIDAAVTDDDNRWADELDQDGDVYVWGDDPEAVDPERITAVRPLGRGGSMAVLSPAVILWSWQPDALEDGVAAATGDEPSLADSAELGPLAEAMDDAGAVGALFSSDAEQFESSGDGPTLEPYTAFATGVRLTDGQPELVITLLHEDDATAEANVDALQEVIDSGESARTGEPWSDLLSVEDITTDRTVLTAVLRPDEPAHAGLWSQLVVTRDNLLAT